MLRDATRVHYSDHHPRAQLAQISVPNFDFLRPKLRIFGKSEQVRLDLFPRFLRPGAVFAKGISDQNHLDQYFRVFGGFRDFRVKGFKIRAIGVICGEPPPTCSN